MLLNWPRSARGQLSKRCLASVGVAPDNVLAHALAKFHRVMTCCGALRCFTSGRHAPATGLALGEPDDRLRRAIQYAAASRSDLDASGILDRPAQASGSDAVLRTAMPDDDSWGDR